MTLKKITVGIDSEGKIGAAHIDTTERGRAFCTGEGLTPKIVEWDGKSPFFGRTVAEINQSK
jgi:hypothetical protein